MIKSTQTAGLLVCAVVAVGCGASREAPLCIGTSQAEIRICGGDASVEGIDVSTYQRVVDWRAVRDAGKLFAIARVSDGVSHVDAQFGRNWPGMLDAGIIRGVYQYFRPSLDPLRQADLLLAHVADAGGFRDGDLPPVLDLETKDGQDAAVVVQRALAWLARIEARTGRRPIVYTAAFMSSVIGTNFSAYPLWVANYGASCPSMPSGWTDWRIWQKSSTGSVPGISGNVDLDVWNGTLAELRAFAGTWPLEDAGADAGSFLEDAGHDADAATDASADAEVDAGQDADASSGQPPGPWDIPDAGAASGHAYPGACVNY